MPWKRVAATFSTEKRQVLVQQDQNGAARESEGIGFLHGRVLRSAYCRFGREIMHAGELRKMHKNRLTVPPACDKIVA